MDQTMDMSELLPNDDELAGDLGHVEPRDLAAVDDHSTLSAEVELLPLSLAGLLINYQGLDVTEFFARPSKTKTAAPPTSGDGKHDFLAEAAGEISSWSAVQDHCNGLLLIEVYDEGFRRSCHVLNPATGWSAPVPRPPHELLAAGTKGLLLVEDTCYLAYDPAISQQHYHIFSVPRFCHRRSCKNKLALDPDTEQSEWPPATCILHVFSSLTGQWEERSFARVGEAAGTVADMRRYCPYDKRYAVYRRGQLYIHCQSNFVMRLSLSNGIYHVIKPPAGTKHFYLGKSEKGVYCASLYRASLHGIGRYGLRVGILNDNESCSPLEWVLKHDQDLLPLLRKNNLRATYTSPNCEQQVPGPWVLLDINYSYYYNEDISTKELVNEEFGWSSDTSDSDDGTSEHGVHSERGVDHDDDPYFSYGSLQILGFHPYKEIIFLSQSKSRALAYHLNSSILEEIGNMFPTDYDEYLPYYEQNIESSFPYTPCWM